MASLRPRQRIPPGQGDPTKTRKLESVAAPEATFQDAARPRPTSRNQSRSRERSLPVSMASSNNLGRPRARGALISNFPQDGSDSLLVPKAPRQPSDSKQKPHLRPPLTHQSQSRGPGMTSVSPVRSGSKSTPQPVYASRQRPSITATSPQPSRTLSGRSAENPYRERSARTSSRTGSEDTISSSAARAQTPLEFDRVLMESPTEIRLARKGEATSLQTVTIYPELDRYRNIQALTPSSDLHGQAHPDMPFQLVTESFPVPPTPYRPGTKSQVSGVSGSPSTRFSESPGPGPYSRDTTPTSVSSHSPGLVGSGRMPVVQRARRVRTGSFGKDSSSGYGGNPASAPTQTLAAIRESLNSSSSSSNGTAKGIDKRERIKMKRLSPMPPSPPPRKSSQKFKKSDSEQGSPAGKQTPPSQSSRRRPSPGFPESLKTASHHSQAPKQPHQPTTLPRTNRQAVPPARPSRDGIVGFQSQLDSPRPIIQSNLTRAPSSAHSEGLYMSMSQASAVDHQRLFYEKGRPASPFSIPQPDSRDNTLLYSNQSDDTLQAQTARSRTVSSPHPTISSRAESRQEQSLSRNQDRATRTPSPNVSTFRTRFPLFGRRNKTMPGMTDPSSTIEKKEMPTRKGPAAGTGHEGYGRLGSNRRRGSSGSTSSFRAAISSQESLTSSKLQDPFLRDRRSPVVIAGGEIIENQNTGYDHYANSNTSPSAIGPGTYRRPSLDSHADSISSREERGTLWPSAIPRQPPRFPRESRSRRPSDSSDSEVAMQSTLAFRRSIQRLKSSDQLPVRVPGPIVVRPSRSGAPSSLDTSVRTDDPGSDVASVGRGRKGSFSKEPGHTARKLTKRARSPRKWNLFGRSQSQPAVMKKALQSTSTVAVTIESVPMEKPKPVAFYAMIDSSEQEDVDMDVEDILREASVLPSPTVQLFTKRERRPSNDAVSLDTGTILRPSREPSMSPSRPPWPARPYALAVGMQRQQQHVYEMQPQPLQALQRDPSLAKPMSQGLHEPGKRADTHIDSIPQASAPRQRRPSRLPQVGRIPKVVSARPEQTSPKSFSRPFNRISLQLPSTVSSMALGSLDRDSVAKGPSPPKSSTPELLHDGASLTGSSTDPTAVHLGLSRGFSPECDHTTEFLAFTTRKDSQTTSCTSSSGLLSFADATAIVPDPSAPLVEDEIWDEYNDLLGEEAAKVSSSGNAPLDLSACIKSALDATPAEKTVESPTIALSFRTNKNIDETNQNGRFRVASSIYSTDITFSSRADETATDQRSSALSQPPMTPFSVTEFVSGYGERNNSGTKAKRTLPSQRSSSSSQQSVRKRKTRVSDGSVYSQISEDNSPISQVNLRVGSMTVSKWLTFGHVLFSPARDNMVLAVSPPNEHSVLVIDGLGNDDWSFYAAETYPSATFFNLSPRAPLPTSEHQIGVTAFPISPRNHHQIQYMSHADKLPFQSEIFTTVVYRFPAAAPETYYRSIINEARRVLKPGGYLELSILDLDLNNMGNRTRRTIRRLKEQIRIHNPDMHLGSTADVILRLLGTRGFTDVKTCRVGIPVASQIPRASGPQTNSEASRRDAEATAKPREKPKKDQRSLAEMINDESPVADESITSMVARVGRWWHSRCYGDAALDPDLRHKQNTTGSSDMWMDRALLAECEEWRTSLKLMVCYARVPDVKRVASI